MEFYSGATTLLGRFTEGFLHRRSQVVPGIAGNAAVAPKRIEQGFLMVEVASDAGLLSVGAAQALRQVRPGGEGQKSPYL
jgi:hypothetical protein